MRTRFPLLLQILLALGFNLMVLAAVMAGLVGTQFGFGGDLLLAGRAGERIQTLSELVHGELHNRPVKDWDGILVRISEAYRMRLAVFRPEGTRVAGAEFELPPEVVKRLPGPPDRRGADNLPAEAGERPAPEGEGGPPPPDAAGPPRRIPLPRNGGSGPVNTLEIAPPPPASKGPANYPRSVVEAGVPPAYWLSLRLPSPNRRPGLVLVARLESLSGGLLFDASPWLYAGAGFMLFTGLFWFFLARSITRAVARATTAAEAIADGHFEVRVPEKRPDELGRLGEAVNRLALRLDGFVTGQKRFLGDTAHELCAPLARLEMGLGALAQRAPKDMVERVDDARDDVREMATLVQELLAFSKAGLRNSALPVETILLAPLVEAVARREAPTETSVAVAVPDDLAAKAVPDLLSRAIANLIRNSFRHASPEGPVKVHAERVEKSVVITVSDTGPGVPPEFLDRIFEPFFRMDVSRDRATGGSGLGLAIVRSCVSACGGKVRARSNEPSGLVVEITLEAAD